MKTLGEQARDFRTSKNWTVVKMAAEVDTSRQNIESLEANDNRIPKYIADLARVIGVTVDEMLATAGMAKKPGVPIERWPFTRVPLAQFLALDQRSKDFVEGQLAAAIEQCRRSPSGPAPLTSLPGVSSGNSKKTAAKRKQQ